MNKKSLLSVLVMFSLWILSIILEKNNINEMFLILIYVLIMILFCFNIFNNKKFITKVKKLNILQKILFITLFVIDIYILGIVDLFSNAIYFMLFIFINYFLGFIFLKLKG